MENRSSKAMAEDREAAVCDAALHWERSDVSEQVAGAASAGSASGACAAGPAEHMDIHATAAAGPAVKRQKQRGQQGKKELAHVKLIDLEVDCEADGGDWEDCALMEWLQAREMHS